MTEESFPEAQPPTGGPTITQANPPGPTGSASPAGAPGSEPPPLTAFAWRVGLVRPVRGRVLAGVCGAFARATNTDPILWRVLLAVLTVFAGIGVLIYLVAWLLLPADGDTASPLEALMGRGRSRTSAVLTAIAAAIGVAALVAFVAEPFRPGLLAIALVGGILLLLVRDQRGRPRQPNPTNPADAGTTGGGGAMGFAPHGPFAPATAPPTYGPPPYASPYQPPPPRPPKPRSKLGLLILSVTLIVLGALTLIDLAGFAMPVGAYPTAALITVGLGLIVGAWFGRARWLIVLGILLSLVVVSDASTSHIGLNGGTVRWSPASLTELAPSYSHDFGDATLDLRNIDFSDQTSLTTVDVSVDVGNLTVLVPPQVDVVVDANVDIGNVDVLGRESNGIHPRLETVSDTGKDGPGGGELHINARVDLGNLEVHR